MGRILRHPSASGARYNIGAFGACGLEKIEHWMTFARGLIAEAVNHLWIPMKPVILIFLVASAICVSQTNAEEDPGQICRIRDFLKHIDYEAALSPDQPDVMVLASLGDEAKCAYRPKPTACINSLETRLNAYVALNSSNQAAQRSVEAFRRAFDLSSTISWTYTVRRGALLSSLSFIEIEAQITSNLGRPVSIDTAIFLSAQLRELTGALCSIAKYSDDDFRTAMDELIRSSQAGEGKN